MKTIYSIIFSAIIFLLPFAAHSQTSHHDLAKLDDRIEVQLDSAAKHMVLFILTQDEKHYTASISYVATSDSLNKILQAKLTQDKTANTNEKKAEMVERAEELENYYKPTLKDDILKEPKTSRTEKYKFQSHTYTIGAKSKKWLDVFFPYLVIGTIK